MQPVEVAYAPGEHMVNGVNDSALKTVVPLKHCSHVDGSLYNC